LTDLLSGMQPEYENCRLSIPNLLPLKRYVIFFFIDITPFYYYS